MAEHAGSSRVRAATAVALVLWAFAWDNARMLTSLTDFPLTHFVPLPRSARLLEVAILSALFAGTLVVERERRMSERIGVVLLMAFIALGTVSTLVGASLGLVGVGAGIQTVYNFCSPLLVALVVAALPGGPSRTAVWLFAAIAILNVLVGWYETSVRGFVGDDVHGLLRDAHHFAMVVWSLTLWLLVWAMKGTRGRLLALAGVFVAVPVALAAANEKSNVAMAGVLLGLVSATFWKRGLIGRIAVLVIFVASGVALRATIAGAITLPASFGRLQLAIDNAADLGIWRGYRKVEDVFAEEPHGLVLGTGPGSYGTAKAVDAVALGGTPPPLAEKYTAESFRLSFLSSGLIGSYVEEASDLSSMIVEFGVLNAMMLVGGVVALLVVPARNAARRSRTVDSAVGTWIAATLSLVGLMTVLSAFYGWSSIQATVWPVAIAAGLLSGRDSHTDTAVPAVG